MGGYALAMELCESEAAGLYSGLFVASMLGCTLVFAVPVAFHILREEDEEVLSFGLLIRFIAIPFGSLVGGLLAGFPMGMLLRNSVPVLLLSLLLVICLKFCLSPDHPLLPVCRQLITALTSYRPRCGGL